MDVFIYDEHGAQFQLPALFSWRVTHGCGEACDAIDCSFAYHPSQDTVLPRAVKVTAFVRGQQVFCGQPDEWTVSQGVRGRTVSLWGRGRQALLMDDEAEPAHFARASWQDILARYVTPKGIAAESGVLPAAVDFHVESGMSLWQVVTAFARDHAGRYPRFSLDGQLLIRAFETGTQQELDLTLRGVSAVCSLNRHGVIARTLVRNRDTLQSYLLKNDAFPGPGGRRQVVTGVGREGVAQMERSARRSMRRSLCGYMTVNVTLPWPFAARPGETLSLTEAPEGFAGAYVVWEAESSCDGQNGAATKLMLVPPGYL